MSTRLAALSRDVIGHRFSPLVTGRSGADTSYTFACRFISTLSTSALRVQSSELPQTTFTPDPRLRVIESGDAAEIDSTCDRRDSGSAADTVTTERIVTSRRTPVTFASGSPAGRSGTVRNAVPVASTISDREPSVTTTTGTRSVTTITTLFGQARVTCASATAGMVRTRSAIDRRSTFASGVPSGAAAVCSIVATGTVSAPLMRTPETAKADE